MKTLKISLANLTVLVLTLNSGLFYISSGHLHRGRPVPPAPVGCNTQCGQPTQYQPPPKTAIVVVKEVYKPAPKPVHIPAPAPAPAPVVIRVVHVPYPVPAPAPPPPPPPPPRPVGPPGPPVIIVKEISYGPEYAYPAPPPIYPAPPPIYPAPPPVYPAPPPMWPAPPPLLSFGLTIGKKWKHH